MPADTHLYHLDPDDMIPVVKYAVQAKTAAERQQWFDDTETLPFEEKKFRASVVSAVNRLGPAPTSTVAQRQERDRVRAQRFKGFSYKEPSDLDDFLRRGGMRRIEENVGRRAAKRAIRLEQELWLPTLQRWAKDAEGIDVAFLRPEIKRLRRILGRKQSIANRRAQTRERVRRHRASRSA